MRLIINTSNLKTGGAIQVAVSIIYELKKFNNNEYYVFLSPVVERQIDKDNFPSNFCFMLFDYPSRFTLFGRDKALDLASKKIKPDCVFSVFGPTYWNPNFPHIIGFAQGLHIYQEISYLKRRNWKTRLKWALLRHYHKYLLKKHADLYVVETEDVKARLAKYLRTPNDTIFVVSNTCSSYFSSDRTKVNNILPQRKNGEFRLLTVTAYYEHKNLEILKEVSDILKDEEIKYLFILTISDDIYKSKFAGYEDCILNVGPISNRECPSLYEECDAMILPTFVECFSASYPEAMVMEKPILTSELSFSQSICGNAASYFDPSSAADIASKVLRISNDYSYYSELISRGKRRFSLFETAYSRCEKYLNICESLIQD